LRFRLTLVCLIFLAFWALRLGTAESAFQSDDSPETAAAGALAGIQHPPGYPLNSLLGRLSTLCFPGNPALAQNLMASLWACLAPALFFVIFEKLSGDWLLASCLAAGFGLMPQLGYQAASAKGGIYTLNLVLTFSVLAGLWQAAKGQGLKWLNLAFFAFGLGLAGHYMSIVLFAPAVWLWSRGLPRKAALCSLPGLSLYLYLPLRSSFHPGRNWGDPETLPRLMACLTRAQYSGTESSRSIEGGLRLAGHFFSLLPAQLPWPFLLLVPLGFWLAWRSRSWQLRPLLASLALHWLAVVFYNNPPAGAPWVIDAFFLPDFALLWLFGGLGLFALLLRLPKRRPWILAAATLTIAILAPGNYRASDYSQDTLAYDYAMDLQESLPPHAVLLAAGGADAFGFWYLQEVEGRRQDLCLVDVPLLSDWYLAELSPRIPELNPAWQSRDAVVNGLLASPMTEPLYYSSHNPGDRGIPLGLVSLAPSPMRPIPLSVNLLAAPWRALRTRFLSDTTSPRDGNRAELMEYYPQSARALADFGRRLNNPQVVQLASKVERNFQYR
jgi:hypothetical protein